MEKNYIILNKIYSNDNSKVFKVKKINTNDIYALKVIKIEAKKENYNELLNYHKQECVLLSELKNESVIEIKDYWVSKDYFNQIQYEKTNPGFKISYLYILMEFIEMNLEQFLDQLKINKNNSKKNNYHYMSLIQISKKLISGLIYLHQKNVIHRDIKPSNILIKKNNNELIVKFCDFGISKKINTNGDKYKKLFEFDDYKTYLYSSPEQLKSKFYNFTTDIFSLGLIFFQLFSQMKTDTEKIITFRKIKNGNFNFDKLKKEEYDIFYLIEKMLKIDYKERGTLKIILKNLKYLESKFFIENNIENFDIIIYMKIFGSNKKIFNELIFIKKTEVY